MGLFDIPDPINYVNEVKDEKLKLAAIQLGMSAAYSQYITALYTTGKTLENKKWIGIFAGPLKTLAASMYKLMALQDAEKLVFLSVPKDLVNDSALLESINFLEEKQK